MARKRNLKKIIILSTIMLIATAFFVNWFLTYRLQYFLRKQMSERVSEATNGFYNLSFDNLSIGLFSGELKIEGLEICPDSAEFERLSLADSLPDVYFTINIQSIDFKGINLPWLLSYRELHFNLFEVKSPIVELNSPYPLKNLADKNVENTKDQNLYEMVSPFFDVVSVKYLNLENATVSYSVAEAPIPSVYALRDVSFHASGFLLDENSSKNGKLLYCDNFDFSTNVRQKLLYNSQLVLNTDNIKLSTEDSIIQIDGIELLPQKHLWETTKNWPSNFVDARIRDVHLKGIAFKREEAKNYLTARLFNIVSSDIEYIKIDTISRKEKIVARKDTVFKAWSLYSILSPILNSTSIDRIAVEETKFKFIEISDKGKDEYILNNFDFWAHDFLVDAQSATHPSLLYSDFFGFNADNLTADMPSRNHRMNIKRVQLDTEKGEFRVKGVDLEPIETKGQYDYMSGTIDSIDVRGLKADDGLDAAQLLIKSPNINYTRNPYFKKRITPIPSEHREEIHFEEPVGSTSIDMVASITKHYYVKNIDIRDANFKYNYISKNGVDIFRINDFSFFARDFLIDDYSRKNVDWYFTCSDLGFYLKQFDNYIADKTYRLSAKDIMFTGLNGKLSLKDVKLIPQEDLWSTPPQQYAMFISPLVEATGVDWNDKRTLKIRDLRINNPLLQLTKSKEITISTKPKGSDKPSILPKLIQSVKLEIANIDNANFSFTDKTKSSKMHSTFNNLTIKGTIWDIIKTKTLSVDDIILEKPSVSYEALNVNSVNTTVTDKPQKQGEKLTNLKIGGFRILDADIDINTTNYKSDASLKLFGLKGLDWSLSTSSSYFKLKELKIIEPLAEMNIYAHSDSPSKAQKAPKDIYSAFSDFAKHIAIEGIDVEGANVDYNYFNNGIEHIKQRLNELNFSLDALVINSDKRKLLFDDVSFSTKDLSFPIDNGFYTVSIGDISLLKQGEKFELNNIRMQSPYSQMEFAYRHPNNKDWFDLSVGSVIARGINLPRYFADSILDIDDMQIAHVDLKNFKNQKIMTPRRLSPIIYEKIQKLPVKFSVRNADVTNFSVTYDELVKKAKLPGKIFFTNMNGHVTGLTNIVSKPNQYINLEADGKLMGTGYFTATWQIPVDPNNDRFLLKGHLSDFDLTELNQLINPMANAQVTSGKAMNTKFDMDASSTGGDIKLSFLYNDLRVNIMKEKDSLLINDKLVTRVANWVIRDHNPNKANKKPRTVDIYVERNPYRSTFNYFWQMLQPALAESAGVSYRTQKFLKDLPKVPQNIRNFFWKEGSYSKPEEKQ